MTTLSVKNLDEKTFNYAILKVTPEAQVTRSFIWDDVPEVFKVRVSESPSNALTKETDDLYVFGDGTVIIDEMINAGG